MAFLLGIYIASIIFTLKLQKPVLSSTSKEEKDSEQENSKKQRWSKKRILIVSFVCCNTNSN
ncbi:hypothetical protein [Candidatus Nitrosocosmicus sp. R]